MKEIGPFPKTARPVILLVDNSKEILAYLLRHLNKQYHIYTAQNSAEAMAILQHAFVQLVISDVMMPKMDGFELCEKIRSTSGLNHIPIILLTANNTLQLKIQGLKMGADAYIEKPFSLEHLYAQIDNLLENRRKLKESYARSAGLPVNNIDFSKEEGVFWKQLTDMILGNLQDMDLDVEKIAALMNMSKSTLYRKIKSISGMSPSDVINLTRLKKSADLMNAGNFRINELAKQVGYHYPAQFRRNFQKQYKMSPAAYIEKVKSAISINTRQQ